MREKSNFHISHISKQVIGKNLFYMFTNNIYIFFRTSCGHFSKREAENSSDFELLSKQLSSWSDTESCVRRVLELLCARKATNNSFLNDCVNEKFLEFHRDITEECGKEEKQHSWAVVEKQEEIFIFGPYFPKYNKGQHSEDIIVKQTQDLLESEEPSAGWEVYVFTMNSPCLTRDVAPCMIHLVQKAHQWWSVYGVRTHVGFMRCWGFRGTKETLFRDVDYSQVDCIKKTKDHEDYVKAASAGTHLIPLSKNLTAAVKNLLTSGNLTFLLQTVLQEHDWRSIFKKMHNVSESKSEEDKAILTLEVNAVTEAAKALLSDKIGSFEEHLENGKEFSLHHTFGSQLSADLQVELRRVFQQCWTELVQNKYAELIRGRLTEDFNQCVVELFINDAAKFSSKFLHIGRIQMSELQVPQ